MLVGNHCLRHATNMILTVYNILVFFYKRPILRDLDNSYPRQLVPRTTRTQDNSYPGQLVPKTTRTQDNSYTRQLVPKTTRTSCLGYEWSWVWVVPNPILRTVHPCHDLIMRSWGENLRLSVFHHCCFFNSVLSVWFNIIDTHTPPDVMACTLE